MKPAELKAAREKLGLSQKELGEALGVDRVSVARWETGARRIPPMLKLAMKALQLERRKGGR